MADFVGLLKKTIDAQNNATPKLRQRIYERARETVEKKLAESNVAPEIAKLQRRIVEKAINEVEELCREADASVRLFLEEQEGEETRLKMELHADSGGMSFVSAQTDAAAGAGKGFPEETPVLQQDGVFAFRSDRFGAGERNFVYGQQDALPGAMFALPENTGLEDRFAEVPAENKRPADMRPPANDELHFLDSAFPSALEALSIDSASADAFPFLEDDKGNEAVPLFDREMDAAQGQDIGETGISASEGGVSAGEELLYSGQADASFELFDMAAPFPVVEPEMRNSGDYQPVPDFLLNDEEVETDSQLYRKENTAGHGGLKAPFAEMFSSEFDMQEQEVTGPPSFVADISSARKTEMLQKAPVFAEDMAPLQAPVQPAAVVRMPPRAREKTLHTRASDVFPPTGPEAEQPEADRKSDDFSMVSVIFAQAAMREKKRSGKKRLLAAGTVIIAILCIIAAILWFLTGFLRQEEPDVHGSEEMQSSGNLVTEERSEKITQRLMPDGQETNPGPAEGQGISGEGTIMPAASPPVLQFAEAVFYEARTALLPETSETGTVKWALLYDKAADGREELAIRGDVSIPGKDMMLRMTIRHNHDSSIPAAYLLELIFIVPENFDGGAVDRVGQLLFKASKQSTGEELQGTLPFKIEDNFFVIAINAPHPFLNRNLSIMRQLPWMQLNIAYKDGRIGEFSFAKGEAGDAVFKQMFDNAAENQNTEADKASGTETHVGQP